MKIKYIYVLKFRKWIKYVKCKNRINYLGTIACPEMEWSRTKGSFMARQPVCRISFCFHDNSHAEEGGDFHFREDTPVSITIATF